MPVPNPFDQTRRQSTGPSLVRAIAICVIVVSLLGALFGEQLAALTRMLGG